MSWLASFGISFITTILGAVGTGFLGALCTDWYRVSNREGGAGYFVIFLGLLGGLVGFIVGLVASRIVAAGAAPGFAKALGVASGSVLGLLLIATFFCWLAADLDTTLHGRQVELQAEIRCPRGFTPPKENDSSSWYSHIDTRSRRVTSRGDLRLTEARLEEGRWIIPMTLDLRTSVHEKLLYVRLAGETELFVPIIPSKPGKRFFSWSEWQDGGWDPNKPRPAPEQRFNLRFRVALAPEPVEPTVENVPDEAELRLQQSLAEEAEFKALTPESPLEQCLKFTHYSQSEARRETAGAMIGRRPNVVAEISEEIRSTDRERADRALRACAVIKPLPAELARPVAEVGDRVISGLETFVASKPEEDPSYQGAADVAVLFSGWFQAHHALHDSAGVDGRTQLVKILELAEKRPDSYVLTNDVARIAKYYVTEWNSTPQAGIATPSPSR